MEKQEWINKTRTNSKCSSCEDKYETIDCIISECRNQAQKIVQD